MSFLCGNLILLLSHDVKAVSKNLQAKSRVKIMDSGRPGTIRAFCITASAVTFLVC